MDTSTERRRQGRNTRTERGRNEEAEQHPKVNLPEVRTIRKGNKEREHPLRGLLGKNG